jgi:hypothetical protein
MTTGLETTKPGRQLITDFRLRLMDREDKVAAMARDYRKANKHIDEGFFDKLKAYSDANPIFSQADIDKAKGAGAGGGAGGANDPLGIR